ncbi:hypothetical protein ACQ4PT_062472 [Festuca glaucescens]
MATQGSGSRRYSGDGRRGLVPCGHGDSGKQIKAKWGRIRQEMGGRKKAKLGGRKKAKPSVSIEEEKLHNNVEKNIVEDFYDHPSKKAKYVESSIMDHPLPSHTISASSLVVSECEESIGRKSDDQINSEPLPTPPSPIKSTLSPVSELNKEETISADDDKKTFSADDDKQQYKPLINNVIYDHLPQDYTITQQDECAHDVILDSLEEEILVKIEDVYVKQRNLVCLLYKDKWLDDEVINAYICCLKEQAYAQNQNDAKVYFENPFVTRLLKRDGEIGIHGPTSLTNIVNNYLNHDLIHLPINIKDSHWYLASINLEKSEIQVLDSLCWEHNRDDLTITLQGLQYHLDILKRQENWSNHKWKDIDVTKWTITEQLQEPIQKDSSSCGLFMLKFMEYWTGHTLSHLVTQEIITSFRYKLAAILLCWKNNTAPPTTVFEEIDDSEGHPDDVIMSDKPFDQNQSNHNNSLSAENRYQSLMSILSNLSIHELVGGLCNYIISINSVETLEKIWIQSSKPYPISLTLKTLQGMLNNELPMDPDYFNLVVRNIMFDDIQMVKKRRGLIKKHYLDMCFWMTTDFGRHPNFRKKLDVEQLANSVRSWPDDQINSEPLPTPPSPIKSTLSPVSELNKEETISADDDKKTFSADDDKQQYKPVINNVIYDHLPQDYTITQQDECAHDVILDSLEEEILVKIEDVYVKQRNLVCLLYKDKWLDDEVISAYICCLKEQAYAQNQNDAKVYFENPFVTRLLKRDGEIGIHGPTSLTNIVNNYLNHDLIHLPINIKDSHWYLASINFEKSEIQVLDSLCWEHNRDDLTITLQGLQYHLDILKRQENWSNHKWKDIDVTKWTITEQLQEPIQKDSSSCGLFMLKFMEYWTGHTLSHLVTQEIITSFRYKLAAILLCWKNNTAPPTTVFEEIDDSEGHPDDVIMSDKPFDQNQSNHNNSLSAENRYQSLMSILSNLSIHELVGGLCNYIISINSVETLD